MTAQSTKERQEAFRARRAKPRQLVAAPDALPRAKHPAACPRFCHEQIAASADMAKRIHGKGKFALLVEKIQSRFSAGLPVAYLPCHIARDAQAAAIFACKDDDATECRAWMDTATAQLNRVIELLEKKP